jgi:hypothetical protein
VLPAPSDQRGRVADGVTDVEGRAELVTDADGVAIRITAPAG